MVYSELEELLAVHLRENGIAFERQYKFALEKMGRKWASDFWLIDSNILVECDGGTYTRGRHNRGQGFHEDRVKDAAATRLGYITLRFDKKQINNPIPGTKELDMDTEAIETIRAALYFWGPNGVLRRNLPYGKKDHEEGAG